MSLEKSSVTALDTIIKKEKNSDNTPCSSTKGSDDLEIDYRKTYVYPTNPASPDESNVTQCDLSLLKKEPKVEAAGKTSSYKAESSQDSISVTGDLTFNSEEFHQIVVQSSSSSRKVVLKQDREQGDLREVIDSRLRVAKELSIKEDSVKRSHQSAFSEVGGGGGGEGLGDSRSQS